LDHPYDIFSLEEGALKELVEACDPEVSREGEAEKTQRVNEGGILVILSNIAHEKRIYATIDVNEPPKLIEDRLVKGYAKDDLLEDLLGLSRYH